MASSRDIKPRIMAEPAHIQRLELALNMRPFMEMAKRVLKQPLSSSNEESDTDNEGLPELKGEADTESDDSSTVGVIKCKKASQRCKKRLFCSKEERQSVKAQLYNFNDLTSDREWLYDLLLSDSESDEPIGNEDEYIHQILREHIREQRQRKNYYKNLYLYFSSNLTLQIILQVGVDIKWVPHRSCNK